MNRDAIDAPAFGAFPFQLAGKADFVKAFGGHEATNLGRRRAEFGMKLFDVAEFLRAIHAANAIKLAIRRGTGVFSPNAAKW